MRQRPAFGWPSAYSGHSTCQMARHERAFGPLKAGGRRVEWYRYGVTSKVGASASLAESRRADHSCRPPGRKDGCDRSDESNRDARFAAIRDGPRLLRYHGAL